MNLKKISFLLCSLVLSFSAFGQPSRVQPFINHLLFSETYQIPLNNLNDSTEILYYIYKIPFSRLVFEKIDNRYTASYRLIAEVHDSVANTISRKIKEDNISVNEFEKTDNDNLFVQGIIDFRISKKKIYNLFPVFSDKNSGREIRLNKIAVKPSAGDSLFLDPLVVNAEREESLITLSNFEGNIPFSTKEYDLIIPCSDTSLSKIFVEFIINKTDTVFKSEVNQSLELRNSIVENNGNIILKSESSSKLYKNFIIPFINKNLMEGDLSINIYKTKNFKGLAASFEKEVKWYDKPFALANPEAAIKFLKYMAGEIVVDSLLDLKEKVYYPALFKFWKRYDPTPETTFNELMNEYYSRVDYTLKNFSSISGKRGYDTDRGRIFILYGKPTELERTSDRFGKIVETWIYKTSNRKFVFVDRTGTGEYQLING